MSEQRVIARTAGVRQVLLYKNFTFVYQNSAGFFYLLPPDFPFFYGCDFIPLQVTGNRALFNPYPSTMNTPDPLLKPLSIEELGLLENFLLSDTAPDESMTSIEMVDGYMTALIVGPELPHPDVWISCIWDQENGDSPVFTSDEEASLLRSYLLRHMNSIALQFEEDPESFLPIYEKIDYQDEDEMEAAVEDWALGFTTGMELTHEAWKPFFSDEEIALLAFPVFVLGRITDDYETMSDDDRDDLVRRLPDVIIRIHEYWQTNR
jgi:uncharacterized protein